MQELPPSSSSVSVTDPASQSIQSSIVVDCIIPWYLPDAQPAQKGQAFTSHPYPAGQAEQATQDSGENFPLLHALQEILPTLSNLSVIEPFGHTKQSFSSSLAATRPNFPLLHPVQSFAATPEYLPAVQALQAVVESGEYRPGAHSLHMDAPWLVKVLVTEPGGHSWQPMLSGI
jgi:hypothetical protein